MIFSIKQAMRRDGLTSVRELAAQAPATPRPLTITPPSCGRRSHGKL